MVKLFDEQVDLLLDKIIGDGVSDYDLQNDLLDHYCCFIEEHMSTGADFETAYKQAFVAITPNGMHEIQRELFIILTFKQTTIMKRVIYGSGFLASFGILTGLMFKGMHWPGSFLMFVGFFFTIITATALAINILKNHKANTALYNSRVILGVISITVISTGNIFKILLFPYANLQIFIGLLLLNFAFLPMFFYYSYKQSVQSPLNV